MGGKTLAALLSVTHLYQRKLQQGGHGTLHVKINADRVNKLGGREVGSASELACWEEGRLH